MQPSSFEIHTTLQGTYILHGDGRDLAHVPHFDSIQDAVRYAGSLPEAIGNNVKVFDEEGRSYLTILLALPRSRRRF